MNSYSKQNKKKFASLQFQGRLWTSINTFKKNDSDKSLILQSI